MSPSRKNLLANYANFLALAIAGLFVNPLLAGALGATAFGIWKSCQKIMDFGTVADGRATQALKWVVAYHAAAPDLSLRQRKIGAALVVWLLWLPVLLLLQGGLLFAMPFLMRDLPLEMTGDLYKTAAFLAANVILTGLVTIPDSVLTGSNLGYRSMIVTTLVTLASNAAMVIVGLSGFGIVWLGLIVMATTLLNGAVTYVIARRSLPWMAVKRPQKTDISEIAKFSGWVLLWSLITKFLLAAEILVLGAGLGATSVTAFTFTSYVIQFALAICLMTTSAQMPGLGALYGKGAQAQAREIAQRGRLLLFALATSIACCVLLANATFVTLWVGDSYFMGHATNIAMALSFLQLAMIRTDSQIQDIGLDIKRKVLIGLSATLLSLLLAYLLLRITQEPFWMIIGLMAGRLPMSFIYPRLVKSLLNVPPLSWRALIASLCLLGTSTLLGLSLPQNLQSLLIVVPLCLVLAPVSLLAMVPLDEIRSMLRNK